jgi:hypothetical protein
MRSPIAGKSQSAATFYKITGSGQSDTNCYRVCRARAQRAAHYHSAAGVVISAAVWAWTVSTSVVMARAASCRAAWVW